MSKKIVVLTRNQIEKIAVKEWRLKMKKDTYLMVNGQKIELTDEQKKQLGIVEEKSCFESVGNGEVYYCIFSDGKVGVAVDSQTLTNDNRYAVANYCTDEDIMHQRAMHETLNRLLWRYSMTHDGDKIDWEDEHTRKWYICCRSNPSHIGIDYIFVSKIDGVVFFNSKIIANLAIEEIIKPFMKEHPDFVW